MHHMQQLLPQLDKCYSNVRTYIIVKLGSTYQALWIPVPSLMISTT